MDPREADGIDRITATISQLLKGQIPSSISLEDQPEGEIRQLSEYVNRLNKEWEIVNKSALELSNGNIDRSVKGDTPVAHSLKGLHATLKHLAWQTGQIAKGDFSQRTDFLGDFSTSFNWMVEQLDSYRARLRKESYHSGMAEMASGVLHNIRNTLYPIGSWLSEIENTIDSLPRENMQRALDELESEASPERREALSKFIQLGSKKMLTNFDQIKTDLDDIKKQAMKIEVILADYDKFSHFERALEPLKIEIAISDAIELMPKNLRSGVRIELEDSLKTAPKVSAERVVLAQIFSNLINNACESIQRMSKEPGMIRIYTSVVNEGDRLVVKTTIADNGEGIPKENLAQIFERGFSTKDTPSGIGLHWCCNAINAMKGSLTVKSDGAGHGSRFHTVIPCSNQQKAG